MAPREGFEPPRPMDSGFRIHRNTGLCDLALPLASCATVISMMFHRRVMEVHFHGKDVDIVVEVKEGDTVRTALQAAGVLPSMVIVSHDETVLPHSTPLNQPVQLLVTTISSGG